MDTTPSAPTTPTGEPSVGTPATGTLPAVSAVPAVGTLPTPAPTTAVSSNGSSPDGNALIQQYEQRLSDLMSKWQKAENGRNEALTRNAELQRMYTELQNTATNSVSTATTAAQNAIDQNTALTTRVAQLEGELRKAETLRQHPELLPYSDFIPIAGTPEEQQQVITKLKEIRDQDLQRIQAGQQPLVAQQAQPALPTGSPAQQQAFFNLLNRATLPPSVLAQAQQTPITVGSTPAMISPTGMTESTPQTINQMLKEAQRSGDPRKFEQAIEQAKTLANQSIRNQLGQG